MKIESLKCPECGGNIDLKEGQKIQYCPYCGTKLFIDDESRTIRKEYQNTTRLEEMKYKRQVELEEREYKKKEDRKLVIASFVIFFVVVILLLIGGGAFF